MVLDRRVALAPQRSHLYTYFVLHYLHTLSAVLFYILGTTFFLAYVLMHNGIAATASLAWLHTGDMPLLLSGLLYGGLSVYRSLQDEASSSKALMLGILIPLAILFLLLLAVNFGPAAT